MNTQDKDQSGAAVRGEAVAETATDQLYGAVMNIPCKTTYIDAVVKMAYKEGHRDARHAAADLIAAFSSARAADALDSQPTEQTSESDLAGWFVYEEGAWVSTSSDWPGATKLYRAAPASSQPTDGEVRNG
jgi:hypothetical protein